MKTHILAESGFIANTTHEGCGEATSTSINQPHSFNLHEEKKHVVRNVHA